MSLLNPLALAASIMFLPQQQDSTRGGQEVVTRPRPALAAVQVALTNVAVNRFDAWVLGQDWARVGPSDWRRNLRLGWEWDEDGFVTNMFAHPYHGGLYFNAARANGLSYWEAVPITFLGSFLWEYFGETYRPSLNDFMMTSFGGVALGEVFHRLGASIRDNTAEGRARTWREIAALPLDPMSGLNRLIGGEWSRVATNPPEHEPEGYVLRVITGLRVAADTGYTPDDRRTLASPTLLFDLSYGDPFGKTFVSPFDVFVVRAQLSPGGGGLNMVRASGRVFGRSINRESARHRHVLAVNHRYDYVSNPAHRFGAQSLEVGVYSRWRISRSWRLRTQGFADGILLGALDAPYTGAGRRTYDFGPGIGFRTEIGLEREGITWATLYGRTEYIHSVSGAEADHVVGFGGLDVTVPVAYGVGVGMHTGYYSRVSRYPDREDETREFPELRLFLVWTTAVVPSLLR